MLKGVKMKNKRFNKKGFEMSIGVIISLILAIALLIGAVWVAVRLGWTDFGLISKIRNLFRFGG